MTHVSFFSDHDEFFRNTKQVLDEMGVQNYTSEDCKIVKYICTLVSARAAFLASAGLATLINRAQKPEMTIAVDGSLYRFHPRFHNLMTLKIQELLKPGLKVIIKVSFTGASPILHFAIPYPLFCLTGQSNSTFAIPHPLFCLTEKGVGYSKM